MAYTCFDIVQNIDIEHLANFFENLRVLVHEHCIISISTCPSKNFNCHNSTLLLLRHGFIY